jgi:pimeloyl-ACP methyl ester carboxylesterase
MFHPTGFPEPTLVSVNGVELEVFEAGRENAGKPIVLCHGWPEHAFSWRHQVPALAAAGYHVIVPNQRGYGNSSRPTEVTDYDIEHLSGDLVALLDHHGYEDAAFVGHDWGAFVVWGLTLLHPNRVNGVVALSLPYQERGEMPWIEFMEAVLGADFYFVHFTVFVSAFESTGFTSSINWYRNLDRNWRLLADVDPVIRQPALMIYGDRDTVLRSERLTEFVPNVDVASLDCGHWIQQEKPHETNHAILKWLDQRAAVQGVSGKGVRTIR